MEEVFITGNPNLSGSDPATATKQVEIGDKLNDIKDILLTPVPIFLSTLQDVNINNPSDGHLLKYDATDELWHVSDVLDVHKSDATNPHSVTHTQVGADIEGSSATVQENLNTHKANESNPHSITAEQAGADVMGSAATVQGNLNTHTADESNPHSVTHIQAEADAAGSSAAVQGNLNTHTDNVNNPHSVTTEQIGATGITYVDRGDPATWDFVQGDFITDGEWHELDLSSIVPEGVRTIHFIALIRDDIIGSLVQLREKGNVNSYAKFMIRTQTAGMTISGDGIISCDVNRKIEYHATATTWNQIILQVRGWFE